MSDERVKLVTSLYQGILRRLPDIQELEHWTRELSSGTSLKDVARAFIECEEFRQSSHVPLFVPLGHFYSPLTDPAEVKRYLATIESAPIPESLPGITISLDALSEMWHSLTPLFNSTNFSLTPARGFRYGLDNPSYSWGDGLLLNAMIRHWRPKKIIEIGNGWSSACILDTVEFYLRGPCQLTFIDPNQELFRSLVGEAKLDACNLACNVQDVPVETFDELGSGDILFIDSTHILKTGSDVCHELFNILPRLKPGVLVHIHDIFWPFEYPRSWAVDENRSWNELYVIRAFLTDNIQWEVVFFNDFFGKIKIDLIKATYPDFLRNPGGALWLRRR